MGDARSVVNVGAGAGSYEPTDRDVTAVEPSEVMVAQRPPGSAPVVRATAGELPFADDSFDAALSVLSVHHWPDMAAGLAELARVARDRVVVVTYDPDVSHDQWIVRDYLPEARKYDTRPRMDGLLLALPGARVEPLLVPRDCTDRMFGSLWGRPEEYLDPAVRAATSVWSRVPPEAAACAVDQLRRDLDSGTWDERYGRLRRTPECDTGLRLVVAELC